MRPVVWESNCVNCEQVESMAWAFAEWEQLGPSVAECSLALGCGDTLGHLFSSLIPRKTHRKWATCIMYFLSFNKDDWFCLEKHYLYWTFKRRETELALKHQGEEEMITYLNTLCVPAIMMGVVKFHNLPDSWSNYDPSVVIGSSYVFLLVYVVPVEARRGVCIPRNWSW